MLYLTLVEPISRSKITDKAGVSQGLQITVPWQEGDQ